MHFNTGTLLIVFVMVALLTGALTRQWRRHLHLPYTVILLVIGLLTGTADRFLSFADTVPLAGEVIEQVANLDPHLLLFIFLPTLIFESAYSLEAHLFRRLFNNIAILAIVGLIISTLLTAVVIKFLVPWDWSWAVALMFGALISATDPVAVVALLKEVSSRKRLETLLEGESLLNDGTAIVLFSTFIVLVIAETAGGVSPGIPLVINVTASAAGFLWVVVGGFGTGLITGWLSLKWIARIYNDPLTNITITIASAYFVYFLAEVLLQVSGVVALVTMALLFAGPGRARIAPEISGFVHQFWEVMAYIANTVIFLLVGILIASRLNADYLQLAGYVVTLYLALLIIRAATVVVLLPLLNKTGVGISREKALVMTWGSLRGAVSLALALMVAQNPDIPIELGDQILFLCACIVVMTIVINGSSMQWLLHKLNLDQLPAAKQVTVERAEANIKTELLSVIPVMEKNEFLKGANWSVIREKLGLQEEPQRLAEDTHLPQSKDLALAFRRQLLATERQHYWLQYKDGLIGRSAMQILMESVEHALDGDPVIYSRFTLHKIWEIPTFLHYLRNLPFISKWATNLTYRRMALGYDMARGFISAQNELLNYVDRLAPSDSEARRVHEEIANNKKDTYQRIQQMRQSFPEVTNALETNAAIRLMLNTERAVIKRLLEHGVLEKPEAGKLLNNVAIQMMELQFQPQQASLPDPTQIISNAVWVKGLSENTIGKLIGIAEHRLFAADELIFTQGEESGSFAIIIRGEATITVQQKSGEAKAHLAGPGEMIGARSILTGIADCTATANTPLDALWMSEEKLKPIMASDPQLVSNILKYLSLTD